MKFSAPALCTLMMVAAANGMETGNNGRVDIVSDLKRKLHFHHEKALTKEVRLHCACTGKEIKKS